MDTWDEYVQRARVIGKQLLKRLDRLGKAYTYARQDDNLRRRQDSNL